MRARSAAVHRTLRHTSRRARTPSLSRGATRWHVNADLDSGANNGVNWDDAFQGPLGLQQALGAAAPGDEVWIAAGTYVPTDDGDRTVSFDIPDGVQLYGGFSGDELTLDERDTSTNPTILSGDLNGDDLPTFINIDDNSELVLAVLSPALPVTIDGLVIRGGNAEITVDELRRGGGMRISGQDITLIDCRVESNTAVQGGGAYVIAGAPTMIDCVFSGNRAVPVDGPFQGRGGAIAATFSSTLTLTGCQFTGNTARAGGAIHLSASMIDADDCTFSNNIAAVDAVLGGGLGGALFSDGLADLIHNCQFTGNDARQGGALNFETASPTITECQFNGNIAQTDPAFGGGLGGAITFAFNSDAIVTDCDFLSNAARVGGALHVFQSAPTLTLCEFNDNQGIAHVSLGGGFGGAANILDSSTPMFTQCTFIGNRARQGGACQVENASPTLIDCDFNFNTAPSDAQLGAGFGGALLTLNGGNADCTESSFFGNNATFGGAVFGVNSSLSIIDGQFTLNAADTSGGAVYLQSAGVQALLFQCMMDDNTAFAGNGGAIVLDGGAPRVDACTLIGNDALNGGGGGLQCRNGTTALVRLSHIIDNEAQDGGGVTLDDCSATLLACTIDNNTASGTGGGAEIVDCVGATIRSCQLTNNDAVSGGGVTLLSSSAEMLNATISDNISGGGAGMHIGPASTLLLANSIIWDNAGDSVFIGAAADVTITHCNIQATARSLHRGDGNIDADPLFADPDNGDYRLSLGSPCIDTADNAHAQACETEAGGLIRTFHGDIGDVVDMGAHEYLSTVLMDCNDNGIDDACGVAAFTEPDCNYNGAPDDCDITSAFSADDDDDGVPDECQRIAGDVNADGIVNVTDLLEVINAWGGCAGDCSQPCPADINFDCAVNVSDLLIVINNWGAIAR